MKKSLNNIFDEANANEIDNLVKQNAASDVSAETLSSIKDKVYAKINLKKEKKNNRGMWMRFGAIAACFLLIVSAIIVVPMLREDDPGVIIPPDDTTNNDNPGDIRLLHWNDISSFFGVTGESGNMSSSSEMYEKAFCEIVSGIYSTYQSGNIISDDCVGDKIDTVEIRTGWYQSWNGEERDVYEVNAEVYKIKDIATSVSVAIKYLENTHADTTEYFYVYSNPYYGSGASLAGFFESYKADKYMSVYTNAHIREYNDGTSTNFAIYDINEDALDTINTQILSLKSANTYSQYTSSDLTAIENIVKNCHERLQLSVEIKTAGRYGVVYVLDNGYICFAGFGEYFTLHNIGIDAAENLIESVKDNSVCINPSVDENGGEIMQPA